MKLAAVLLFCYPALSQSAAVIVPDLATAQWTHDAKDGSDSVVLREDPKTGGMELLVRYPSGHKIAAHWHGVNERLILLEGKVTVAAGEGRETTLLPGGPMLAPPREPHRLTCISAERCTFYIAWDGKPDTHKVQ